MVIQNYGVTLKRVEEDDLELLRSWRNSDYVKQFMVFREFITEEMQKKWFTRINNDKNYYFIILDDATPVGLVNIKDIDNMNKTGESGIFLCAEEYTNSEIGTRATLSVLDFAFLSLKLEKLYQTIINANKAAINFNKHLGVCITETGNDISQGFLNKEIYLLKSQIIRNLFNK